MKKFEFPAGLEWRLRVRKPARTHRAFRILKQWDENGRTKSVTVEDLRLDKLNIKYVAGKLTEAEVLNQIDLLLVDLYKQAEVRVFKPQGATENKRLVDQFFEEEYKHRVLVDKYASYQDYARAVDLVGDISLHTANEKQLQARIDERTMGNVEKQRRIVRKITTLLLWLGRYDVKLRKHKPQRTVVKYITERELEKLLPVLDPNLALMARMAFYTGCRMGELFGLEESSWVAERTIRVEGQIDRKGEYRDTKNRSTRLVYFLSENEEYFREWLRCKGQVPDTMRFNASAKIKAACRQVFPNSKNKHIKFHDLRHSYAIHLIQNGVNLTLVAQALGNTIKVTEKHYVGYTLTNETIEVIKGAMNKKSS
jgi:integrase